MVGDGGAFTVSSLSFSSAMKKLKIN